MKSIILLITLLAILSCKSMKDDLDKICTIAEQIQKNETLNNTEKVTSLVKEINQLNLKNETKKYIIELSMKESSPSYEDYINFAEKNGINNWKCTALKKIHDNE